MEELVTLLRYGPLGLEFYTFKVVICFIFLKNYLCKNRQNAILAYSILNLPLVLIVYTRYKILYLYYEDTAVQYITG